MPAGSPWMTMPTVERRTVLSGALVSFVSVTPVHGPSPKS
jgi:hypothetical protein